MTLKELSEVLEESVTVRIDLGDRMFTCYANDSGWLKDYILEKKVVSINMSSDQIDVLEVTIA